MNPWNDSVIITNTDANISLNKNIEDITVLTNVTVGDGGMIFKDGIPLHINGKQIFWINNQIVDTFGNSFSQLELNTNPFLDRPTDDDGFILLEEQACLRNGCDIGYTCVNKGRNVYTCEETVEDVGALVYIFYISVFFISLYIVALLTGPIPKKPDPIEPKIKSQNKSNLFYIHNS